MDIAQAPTKLNRSALPVAGSKTAKSSGTVFQKVLAAMPVPQMLASLLVPNRVAGVACG